MSFLLPENPLTLALQRFPHFLPPHTLMGAQRFPPANRMANTLVGARPGIVCQSAPWCPAIFLAHTTRTPPSGRGALGRRRGSHPPSIRPILLSGFAPASSPKSLLGTHEYFCFTRLKPALPEWGLKLGGRAPTPRPMHLPSVFSSFPPSSASPPSVCFCVRKQSPGAETRPLR